MKNLKIGTVPGCLVLALLAGCILAGCATLSESECKTANWFQIGRDDGSHGYPRSRLYKNRQACAEYGIRPNSNAYYAGRKAGLARYCTPENGFHEGQEGNGYRNVCPSSSEPDFLAQYRQGQAIHEVNEDIDRVERAIDRKESRLDDKDTTHKQADELRESLRRDYHELHYHDRELRRLERQHIDYSRYPR